MSDRRTVQESLLAKIPQVDVKLELDDPPTREEIKKATMQLKVTKLQVYRAVVVTSLLYGVETLVLYRKQIRLLEWFHQRRLRSILGIKWQDHVSSKNVLKRASLLILLQVQLRWAGHVTRMEDVRIPKAVFFSELQEGKRDHGAPRKRYKDQLKRQLSQAGISHQSWQQEA